MTTTTILPAARRWHSSPAAAAAALLTVGGALYLAMTYGSHPQDGLLYMSTVGLPLLGFWFFVFYGAVALTARLARRPFPRLVPRVIVPACAVLAVALPLLGYRQSRPLARFEALLMDPAPRSLRDLRVEKVTTFSDGSGWALSFHLSPEDFALLQSRHGLREMVEARARRERIIAQFGDDVTEQDRDDLTEDGLLRRMVPDFYKRPRGAIFFRGGADNHMLVVTDESRTQITVFIDQFHPPAMFQAR
jgi:hypothetical protein